MATILLSAVGLSQLVIKSPAGEFVPVANRNAAGLQNVCVRYVYIIKNQPAKPDLYGK